MAGPSEPKRYLELAEGHLEKVQAAAFASNFAELGTHGLLCLEALVRSVGALEGAIGNSRWGVGRKARSLAGKYPLPDITVLLENLKAASASEKTDLSALEIAFAIEDFFDCVHAIIKR